MSVADRHVHDANHLSSQGLLARTVLEMNHHHQPAASQSNLLSLPELSASEQAVLDEYERLAQNMKKVGKFLLT